MKPANKTSAVKHTPGAEAMDIRYIHGPYADLNQRRAAKLAKDRAPARRPATSRAAEAASRS